MCTLRFSQAVCPEFHLILAALESLLLNVDLSRSSDMLLVQSLDCSKAVDLFVVQLIVRIESTRLTKAGQQTEQLILRAEASHTTL